MTSSRTPMATFHTTCLLVLFSFLLDMQYCQQTTPDEQSQVTPSSAVGKQQDKSQAANTKEVPPEFTFAVWNSEGKICILAKLTASFTITYPSAGGEQTVSVPLAQDARAKGKCGKFREEPVLELSWSGFTLRLIFTTHRDKDKPVPDSWELMSMELLYDTRDALFDGASNVGKQTARSQEEYPLFHTPFGKSYLCPSPDVITMYNTKKDRVVLARLQDVRLQVYDVQKGKFSPVQRCSLVRIGGLMEPFAQDETVPIAVGSTLAVLSVVVILGYALYRNLAIRKTEYSYME